MNSLQKILRRFFIVGALVAISWGFVELYPYIFAKTIEGRIEKVERIELNVTLMAAGVSSEKKLNPEIYSFAVAIKSPEGRIWTASSEDRQWASMSAGYCVKAKYFPYPPWKLDKSGTYYGARLLEASDCSKTPSN